jgi:hypothetical protein
LFRTPLQDGIAGLIQGRLAAGGLPSLLFYHRQLIPVIALFIFNTI